MLQRRALAPDEERHAQREDERHSPSDLPHRLEPDDLLANRAFLLRLEEPL
jgi:hypothetical protein